MGKDKKKPGKPLTGLAAALVKSGHLSEKAASKIQREQRREDKALGREGVEQRDLQKAAEAAARRAAEAEADRVRQAEVTDGASRERAARTVREAQLENTGGRRRWFFVARGGRIRFFEVDDTTARLLMDGEAGIVESVGEAKGEHTLVGGQRALGTLAGIDPELVRFWNRPGQPQDRP